MHFSPSTAFVSSGFMFISTLFIAFSFLSDSMSLSVCGRFSCALTRQSIISPVANAFRRYMCLTAPLLLVSL